MVGRALEARSKRVSLSEEPVGRERCYVGRSIRTAGNPSGWTASKSELPSERIRPIRDVNRTDIVRVMKGLSSRNTPGFQ